MFDIQMMPDDSIYIFHTGEKILGDGHTMPFPVALSNEDVFVYGDYKYTYYKVIDGWKAEVNNKALTKYGQLLEEIAGKPLSSLQETFKDCTNLVEAPEIPDCVIDMRGTFLNCSTLRNATLGSKVADASHCFENCTALEVAPRLPVNINTLNYTFANCSRLYEAPDCSTNRNIISMEGTFMNCTSMTEGPFLFRCMYLKTIKNAFKGCVNMAKIPELPKNIEYAQGAFYNCARLLVKPTLPISTQTDEETFAGCGNMY